MARLGREIEAQGDRSMLWVPVALGAGCAIYFALPAEPRLSAMTILAVPALAAAVFSRRPTTVALRFAILLAACVLAGMVLAKGRTERVRAPVASAAAGAQALQAYVVDVGSPGAGGPRLLLAPTGIGGWAAEATPERVRVTLRAGTPLPKPGDHIRLLAILNPPPPPASPGSYDFARDAYFESIGAVGLALGAWTASEPPGDPPARLAAAMRLNAVRWALTLSIVESLGPETGGLAAAMTTGHEAFIPPQQLDDLRTAGLAHIVSISGLHMAIVGGFAFGLARLVCAAVPRLALRVSGKKIAAVFGITAVGGYLLLSGSPPPAERAAVTAAMAFLAILADRQAISLQALALAAIAVLLLQPEAVVEPGFQMSFAATAALVALAEAWPRQVREISVPWYVRAVQGGAGWLAASIAASFVAGLATSPFAIQHFNRVATWGLLANLAVAPISSFVMMPALAVGAVLQPLGLGGAPLAVAGWAIAVLAKVAALAAAAPSSQLLVASAPAWALPASFLGILLMCLWRGRLRWLGVPLALAVQWAPRPPPPDIWVSADGAAVAVRSGAGAVLLRPDVKRFGAELWSRRRGLEPDADAARRDAGYDCDDWSCRPKPGAPIRISSAWNLRRPLKEGRLASLCQGAEIVVLRNDIVAPCGDTPALSRADFARGGSVELRKVGGRWLATWAQDVRGHRPWTWGYDPRGAQW